MFNYTDMIKRAINISAKTNNKEALNKLIYEVFIRRPMG